MIINHPILGPRDANEFVYKGDAELLNRPHWTPNATKRTTYAEQEEFHDYLYLRNNPAGEHRELWYHEQGDRSWLIVTRDTLTHQISKVELVREFLKEKAT